MNGIINRQNEPISISRLKAQRRVYKRAKNISYISFAIFVVPVVFGNIAKIWMCDNEIFMQVLVVYAAIATVLKLVFSGWVKSEKKKAASVQQLFDTYIYQMSWKKDWGCEPSEEYVNAKARKETDYKLYDWYEPLISKAEHNVGVLLCQMENMRYDEQLKEKYYRFVNILFYSYVALFVVAGVCCFSENVVLFLIHTIVPLAPIIAWYWGLMSERKKEVEQRNKLEAKISAAWKTVKSRGTVSMHKLEEIQDILLAYRSEVYAVPDVFYHRHRDVLDGIAYQSSKDRLIELGIIKQE